MNRPSDFERREPDRDSVPEFDRFHPSHGVDWFTEVALRARKHTEQGARHNHFIGHHLLAVLAASYSITGRSL